MRVDYKGSRLRRPAEPYLDPIGEGPVLGYGVCLDHQPGGNRALGELVRPHPGALEQGGIVIL